MTESQWKWTDIIIKGLGIAIITSAITLYGIRSQETQDELARQDRRVDANLKYAASQKSLDANLGMQLFQKFVEHYLETESDNSVLEIEETILMLRIIALNFQDVPINLKPLYENLDKRILAGFLASNPEMELVFISLHNRLRDVAKEVANRQAFRLTFLDGELLSDISLEKNGEAYFNGSPYGIKIINIKEGRVQVVINESIYDLDDDGNIIISDGGKHIGPFWVSYYDMPLVDNVKVNDTNRISISLKEIVENEEVKISMMRFSSDLASDRFDIKEMSRGFTEVFAGFPRADKKLSQFCLFLCE